MIKKFIFALGLILFAGACSHPVNDVADAYDSSYDRFIQNVRIKAKNPNYITYEYKDVRIDEIAFLASRYCDEQGHKKAYLRDSILYRNFSRRATFDCLELQN